MNFKRFVLAVLGAFASVFVFEMLWHGFLMKGMYEATMSVWRPESECNMTVMLVSQFLFAGVLAYIYTLIGSKLPCKRGVAFGFFAGLILGVPQLATYCYLPIPLSISLMWVLASIVKCTLVGMAIACIYKEK